MGRPPLSEFLCARPPESHRLVGIERTEGWLRLGQTAISTSEPIWRFDVDGWLADSARYYAVPLAAEPAFPTGAIAVFFRQFDSSPTEDSPADYYAGWVPGEAEDDGLAMVATMNEHLDRALTWKKLEQNDAWACARCERGRVDAGVDVRRVRRGDRYFLVGSVVCTACGWTGRFEAPLRFEPDPAAPGNPPLRDGHDRPR